MFKGERCSMVLMVLKGVQRGSKGFKRGSSLWCKRCQRPFGLVVIQSTSSSQLFSFETMFDCFREITIHHSIFYLKHQSIEDRFGDFILRGFVILSAEFIFNLSSANE